MKGCRPAPRNSWAWLRRAGAAACLAACLGPRLAFAAAAGYRRLAVGLGVLDLRARLALSDGWDLEARAAWWPSAQACTARLYWDFMGMGPLRGIVGMEGGGGPQGWVGGALVGLELPFGQRLKLSGDMESLWVQGDPQDPAAATQALVFHVAIYAYLY